MTWCPGGKTHLVWGTNSDRHFFLLSCPFPHFCDGCIPFLMPSILMCLFCLPSCSCRYKRQLGEARDRFGFAKLRVSYPASRCEHQRCPQPGSKHRPGRRQRFCAPSHHWRPGTGMPGSFRLETMVVCAIALRNVKDQIGVALLTMICWPWLLWLFKLGHRLKTIMQTMATLT